MHVLCTVHAVVTGKAFTLLHPQTCPQKFSNSLLLFSNTHKNVVSLEGFSH